jgi:excisionase family DNA binding protein
MLTNMRKKLTPPTIARLWGISADKVLAWVRSGELRAANVATRPGGRPRYLIDEKDLEEFEAGRAVVARTTTKRRKHASSVIEYF